MRADYYGSTKWHHPRLATVSTMKASELDRLEDIECALCGLGWEYAGGAGGPDWAEYYFHVRDYEEFQEFMEDWKELRRKIK